MSTSPKRQSSNFISQASLRLIIKKMALMWLSVNNYIIVSVTFPVNTALSQTILINFVGFQLHILLDLLKRIS